ncbi:hypothetical protein BDZ97DRAFT_1424740 [Flammula alnicola]|nr:hypothetical protein BDZ97DRAFT_1424740 [Flammula alnicola]
MKRRVEQFMNNMDLRICGPKPSLSAGTQSDCTIQPNPDIAGIGGRVALYAQSVLLGFLLVFSPKLDAASPARWALGVSALGFLASAIISSITNQITLYHLEVATQMQEIPLVILTTAEFVSPRSRGPYILILYLIRGLMYAAVVYWGGIQGPCFGTQSECNGTMLVNNGLILWFSRSTRIIDPQHRFRGMFFTTIMVWYVLANILFDPETYLLAAQSLISSKSRHQWIKLPPVWYFALNWRIRIRPLGVDLYSTPPNRLPEGHPWSSISDVDGSLTPAITDAGYSELGFGRRPSPHRFLGFYIFPIPLSQRTRHPWLVLWGSLHIQIRPRKSREHG